MSFRLLLPRPSQTKDLLSPSYTIWIRRTMQWEECCHTNNDYNEQWRRRWLVEQSGGCVWVLYWLLSLFLHVAWCRLFILALLLRWKVVVVIFCLMMGVTLWVVRVSWTYSLGRTHGIKNSPPSIFTKNTRPAHFFHPSTAKNLQGELRITINAGHPYDNLIDFTTCTHTFNSVIGH